MVNIWFTGSPDIAHITLISVKMSLSEVDCFVLYGIRLSCNHLMYLMLPHVYKINIHLFFFFLPRYYFMSLLLLLRKFLESNRHFTLKMDSDVCDSFIVPSQSRYYSESTSKVTV
jgi:hypothetical protein